MKPTETELREKDAWIAEHVMGLTSGFEADGKDVWYGERSVMIYKSEWRPTTDRADAMAVLEKCLDKITVMITQHGGGFWLRGTHNDGGDIVLQSDAPTLELAICEFAIKLHSL